eukprot:COSAG02_NODE_56358_length_286_cov_0.545455_1_plen_95_part_11
MELTSVITTAMTVCVHKMLWTSTRGPKPTHELSQSAHGTGPAVLNAMDLGGLRHTPAVWTRSERRIRSLLVQHGSISDARSKKMMPSLVMKRFLA